MLEASKYQMLVSLSFIVKSFNKQLTIQFVNYLKSFWNKHLFNKACTCSIGKATQAF